METQLLGVSVSSPEALLGGGIQPKLWKFWELLSKRSPLHAINWGRIIDLINFTCIVNSLGRIFLKRVNRHLRDFARVQKRGISVPQSQGLKQNLSYLLKAETLDCQVSWRIPQPSLELFTNAWNMAMTDGQSRQGLCSVSAKVFHINLKEFMAVWIAVRNCKFTKGSCLRLHLNNSSEISLIVDAVDSLFSGFADSDFDSHAHKRRAECLSSLARSNRFQQNGV